MAVFLAREGAKKAEIESGIESRFGYDLDRTVLEIRPDYGWEVSCQRTVPEAMICFLDSVSFEDAVRNAVFLGGDSDTLACIAGAVAEAYYREIPDGILGEVMKRLPKDLRIILTRFYSEYGNPDIRRRLLSIVSGNSGRS